MTLNAGWGNSHPKHLAPAETFSPLHFVEQALHDLWNWRLLNTAHDYLSPTIALESASMRRAHGINDYQAYVLSLLAPFPDLSLTVEHGCYVGDEQDGLSHGDTLAHARHAYRL
ncbi:MAG UNVERIFIED_CONTAM: ester cyclase [Anaerolineae bacterium]